MSNKMIVVLVSVISFLLLIFIAVPRLIENGQKQQLDNKFEFEQLENLKSDIERGEVEEFLNSDNLYENYIQNYTIKIPENYIHNNGIGKYSSAQFYNEDLGYVVAINVGDTNLGQSFKKKQNNLIIESLSNELENGNSLRKIFAESMTERGFYKPNLVNHELVNYNNRLFLKLFFIATRISDNEQHPVLITNFISFHNNLVYHFTFTSNKKNSFKKWNSEIQKSMSNVMISDYIVQKN